MMLCSVFLGSLAAFLIPLSWQGKPGLP